MNKNKNNISWSSARKICIIKTLAQSGHYPTRKSEKEAWFLSPLRSETQASFSVSLRKNLWYDYGLGKGGNIIDLVMAIYNCSALEAVQSLQGNVQFSFCPKLSMIRSSNKDGIFITDVKFVSHPALIKYLKAREIPFAVAKTHCREVRYRLKTKPYFALGLQNDLGGWELRNKYFKISSSPKFFTYFKRNSETLIITEGMFDYLSLAVMEEKLVNSSDVIVLNSLGFAHKILEHLSGYKNILLYLDNDTAGDKVTNMLLQHFDTATDERVSYKGFKDLNEKLKNEKV